MAPTHAPAVKGISALNVYKKVAIVRRSTDSVTYEDTEGNLKTVTDLGEAASTSTPSLKPKPKTEIPVPQIQNVETYHYDIPPTFAVPKSYVRYRKLSVDQIEQEAEYLADAEDETWLLNNLKFGTLINSKHDEGESKISIERGHGGGSSSRRRPQLSLVHFERMLDILEKATGFETIITQDQAERLICSKIPQLLHIFPTKGKSGTITLRVVIQDVYSYWVQKRSKLKRPLLRRFWPVTASDDTNPHLVFRPREKEKYKLRKKRQNDMDAYRKMKQLRSDFDKVRILLDLVRRREELNRLMVEMQGEWFQQRLYDIRDTSGWQRVSSQLSRDEIERLLDTPKYFDTSGVGQGKKNKRKRSRSPAPQGVVAGAEKEEKEIVDAGDTAPSKPPKPIIVAGRNHGEPAPQFLHPLQTRESYTTSWDDSVPFITNYVNSHATPTFRFRHRPRIGRGGRVVLDRLPHPGHPTLPQNTVYVAGEGVSRSLQPKERLLDLLPRPLDHASISQKIEEVCANAIKEDVDATALKPAAAVNSEADERDGDAVLVKVDDWLDTDEQLWGEERFAIGPI